MSDEVLQPCPFCGNDGSGPITEALHTIHGEHDHRPPSWTVQCDRCTATMGYSDSEEEAIEAWNTRSTEEVQVHFPAVPPETPAAQAYAQGWKDAMTQARDFAASLLPGPCEDEGCPHYGTPHECFNRAPAA